MQEHLKERLTGATILVIAVLWLVPEMFRGRPLRPAERPEPPRVSIPAALPPASTPAPAVSAPPASESASPGPPAAADSAAPLSAGPAVTPSPAPAPAPASTPASQPTSGAPAAASRWTVQAGTFMRRDFAERMAKQLRGKGFTVTIAGPDDRGRYRVRTPATADRADAAALRQQMMARGFKPIVNTAP